MHRIHDINSELAKYVNSSFTKQDSTILHPLINELENVVEQLGVILFFFNRLRFTQSYVFSRVRKPLTKCRVRSLRRVEVSHQQFSMASPTDGKHGNINILSKTNCDKDRIA